MQAWHSKLKPEKNEEGIHSGNWQLQSGMDCWRSTVKRVFREEEGKQASTALLTHIEVDQIMGDTFFNVSY